MTQFRFSLKITTVIRIGVVGEGQRIPFPFVFPFSPPASKASRGVLSKPKVISTIADRQVPLVSLLRQWPPAQRSHGTPIALRSFACAGAMRAVRSRSRCNSLRGTAKGKPTRGKERKKQIPYQPPRPPPQYPVSVDCFPTTRSAS